MNFMLIFTVIIFMVLFVVLGLRVRRGEYRLIPTMKNMRASKVEQYDLEKVCKFLGTVYLICPAILAGYLAGYVFEIHPLSVAMTIAFLVLVLLGTIVATELKIFKK